MPGAPATPRGPAGPPGAEPHATAEQRLPGLRPPTAGGAGPPRKTLHHHHPSAPRQTPPARAPLRTAPLSAASPCPEAEEAAIKLGESTCGWMRGEGRDPGVASARPLPTQALFRDGGSRAGQKHSEETAPWRFPGASRRHQPCPRLSGAGTALHGSLTTATPKGTLSLRPLAQNWGQPWESRFNHTPELPAEVSPAPWDTRVSPVHTAAGCACPVTGLSPVSPCPGVLLGSPAGTRRRQLGS